MEISIKRAKNWIKQKIRYWKFKRKTGFYPLEIWNLNTAIAEFTLPRLKYFRDNLHSYPVGITMEKWHEILDDMIYAFDFEVHQWDNDFDLRKELDYQRVQRGFKYFGIYLRDLWD
jgi:hypothetical protein